ncbi:type II toxin-antitoxin system VapC family toxin [Candidatus Micrarchaeota archaeon]|nr:type II toxin-antitoxin system VapC family toxin [Candidatus Micrarchaeota archaeon]
MTQYLLDASAILHIVGGTPQGARIRDLVRNGESATSIICYCEVLNKADLDKLAKAEAFMSNLLVFPFDVSDGSTAKKIQLDCRRNGGYVPTLDCMVAATAIQYDCELVTSDSDFERIGGLKKHLF